MPNTELLLPESIGKRVDPTYSKTLQNRLQELLHCQADCFPGSQPVSFESKHLEDIQREDYFVCEKSDGVRYLLFFLHSSKGPASFLYDRNKYWYYVPNLLFPVRGRENEYLKDTLMDGELVLDIDQHKKTWRYLIFDLMVVNGSTIIQRSFSTRLGMLQQDVIQPFNTRMRTQTDPSTLPPFTIELKKMERSYGLRLVFDQIPKLKHKSDGIIWTPVKYPYTSGSCEKLLKWKPPELNTVDFRIAARWSKEHKPIYSIEVLSNGVTYKFYDHFQPEPALATKWKSQLPDGRIAEFRYDPDCEVTIIEQGYAPTVRKGGWRFVRFRDDKSTANDEMIVKKVMNSIQDGVTKDQLLLYMDRVRAAWKAREKGLPIPPLHTAKPNLALSTQLLPTSYDLNTPTSANTILQSPSSSSGTGYFRDDHSRNNSISDDNFIKRKTSISSATPLKEEEIKRLKPVKEETKWLDPVKEETAPPSPSTTTTNVAVTNTTLATIPVDNNNTQTNTSTDKSSSNSVLKAGSPPQPVRRRKISSININDTKKHHNDPDLPASNEKKQRITQKRTASAPNLPQSLLASPTPLLPPPLIIDNPNRPYNRRSKSIPQLPKENNSKKIKQVATTASSSSIHNLLTTSVESTTTRAYNFSAILQKDQVTPPQEQQQQQQERRVLQQQQVLQQQALHQQHVLQQQTIQQHTLQPLPQHPPQHQPVQFINFHADGRQNSSVNKNHVLIIRSESQSHSSTPAWKPNHGQSFPYSNSSYQSPYQEHYQPGTQTYRHNEQQVAQDYTSPQQQQQSKRKNSQKAKLDFILN